MSKILPPELETEILIRVPVKSLLKFKRVCKRWRSLISSAKFIAKHLEISSSNSKTLVRYYSKTHSKEIYRLYNDSIFDIENSTRISYPFNERSEFYFRIVGSCNGLLCLSDDLFGCRDTIIIWNPSIKRAITLPNAKTVFKACGPYMFALGFGYDAKNDDYKVVRVAYVYPSGNGDLELPPRVEVYSVLSGKWASLKPRIVNKVKSYITEHFWSQAVMAGVVHWVAYKMTRGNEGVPTCNSVMTFDLSGEKFGELSLPVALANVLPMSLRASVIRGSLSVLYYGDFLRKFKDGEGMSSCVIWVMKEYGNTGSWTQLYNVNLDSGLGQVLGMNRDGEIVCCGQSGELVSYNCENMTVSGTGICGTQYSFFVDEYVESLVLLGKGREVAGKKLERDYEDEDEEVEKDEYMRKLAILTCTSAMIFN